ncbi:anthocyanidin 3-O-glucosyltransferase 5-like [Cornus florida]|uniref:anthocyanidin 3-O-glucosyltransferase 5-like n=1 Tax=Cornus florida TaxID=4283 RepID=UPI0028971AB2|nr:anthocyanidin 3-O-glucosyltransferase 5-like [Cornus florida]
MNIPKNKYNILYTHLFISSFLQKLKTVNSSLHSAKKKKNHLYIHLSHIVSTMDSKLHFAILSSPGMGHLIPVLMLGERLVTHHDANVTILVVTTHSSPPPQSQLLNLPTAPKSLRILHLPPVDISGLLDPAATVVTQLAVMMREARPAIRSAISSMNSRPHALVVDLFGTESLEIADEFNMPKYVYVPSTAWFVAFACYCHVLDKEVTGEYVDQTEPLRLPGCRPVRPEDVVDPMLDRNDQTYHEHVRIGFEYSLSDGILVNTWDDLEPTTLRSLREDETLRSVVKVPVYPVGPLRRPVECSGSRSELLKWLDLQPSESVIYVSFGSGGTLSAQQMTELAWGLELSRQRFVWVVREPIEGSTDASFFKSRSDISDNTIDYLPDGFLNRTHKVGVVVPLWAPQVEILSHPSVGGFVSHCGWNSSLESIVHGVPMIAWPLYAEQRLNAALLTEELGVAVRPRVLPTKKVVGREEIERMVRTVMECKEGKLMRERVKELKYSAEKALKKDGSSYNSLCEVIKDCDIRLESHKAKVG